MVQLQKSWLLSENGKLTNQLDVYQRDSVKRENY